MNSFSCKPEDCRFSTCTDRLGEGRGEGSTSAKHLPATQGEVICFEQDTFNPLYPTELTPLHTCLFRLHLIRYYFSSIGTRLKIFPEHIFVFLKIKNWYYVLVETVIFWCYRSVTRISLNCGLTEHTTFCIILFCSLIFENNKCKD